MQQLEQRQVESVKNQLVQRLKDQCYEVEQDASLTGKSGGEHSFDILARKSHDFIAYTISIEIVVLDDNQEISLAEVFTFDDKCYDCGIQDKVLVAFPKVDSTGARFARSQRINVFDKEGWESFLASPPPVKQGEKIAYCV